MSNENAALGEVNMVVTDFCKNTRIMFMFKEQRHGFSK